MLLAIMRMLVFISMRRCMVNVMLRGLGMRMPHRAGGIHDLHARMALQADAKAHEENHEWTRAAHMV